MHADSCTLHVCPSQDLSYPISILCLLGRWVEFEFLFCCDFPHFLGLVVDEEGRLTSTNGIRVSKSRFRVLVRLLITYNVCNVFKVKIVLTCQFQCWSILFGPSESETYV